MTHELNMMDYLKWIKEETITVMNGGNLKPVFKKAYKYNKIMNKMKFNDSQPKLGDFVPTNKKGEVMEKPKHLCQTNSCMCSQVTLAKYSMKKKLFQSALDRRLWVGWEIEGKSSLTITVIGRKMQSVSFNIISKQCIVGYDGRPDTYEKLITSGVKLERIQKK